METYSVGDIVVVLTIISHYSHAQSFINSIGIINKMGNQSDWFRVAFSAPYDLVWLSPKEVRLATDKEALQWRLTK
jgi:hypothetical protein